MLSSSSARGVLSPSRFISLTTESAPSISEGCRLGERFGTSTATGSTPVCPSSPISTTDDSRICPFTTRSERLVTLGRRRVPERASPIAGSGSRCPARREARACNREAAPIARSRAATASTDRPLRRAWLWVVRHFTCLGFWSDPDPPDLLHDSDEHKRNAHRNER
jgi:hypothetical protein